MKEELSYNENIKYNSKILNFLKYFLCMISWDTNFLLFIFFKIIFYAYTFPKFPNILIFYII